MGTSERHPSMEEFVREVIVALRAAGLEGEVTHDRERARLVHGEKAFDLTAAYQQLGEASGARRIEMLAKAARVWVHPPVLPETWAKASELVVPYAKSRMSSLAEQAHRQASGTDMPMPQAEFTKHVVFDLAVPIEGGAVFVPMASLAQWGVDRATAFDTAGRNLARRSEGGWLSWNEAPRVFSSPWKDGLDASRIFLPKVFAGLPLQGRAVVIAPSPSQILVTGDQDGESLFHMARYVRGSLQRNQAFHFLRALRMGEDGESWEDWEPPRSHPAYDPLRFLRGVQEVNDYDVQAAIVQRLFGDRDGVTLARLGLVQSNVSGEWATVTVWRDGGPIALPKADAVIFVRGEEVLGIAPWEHVLEAMPDALDAGPMYPSRYVAAEFPEWQIGRLELHPWGGPLPS